MIKVEIFEQIAGWSYIKELPKEYLGFTLECQQQENGEQYNIFCYKADAKRRSFSVVYDNVTKDFLARIEIGLTEYYDIRFITTDLLSEERVLRLKLEQVLADLAGEGQGYESVFRMKKILEWPYIKNLPASVCGFELFIQPDRAIKVINGSYVIIDYSDFEAASNLIVYYNVYRDEFFGELRLDRTPQMTALFDAKELDDLALKLEENLLPSLEALRGKIAAL
ncbi:MAG: hypothetical protein H6Q75_1578 [Firmicutes bacterium]|nr:hypothetical protein [Bacillota bacterium]